MNLSEPIASDPPLSPWWRRSLLIVMILGFAVLGAITALAYRDAPPIPGKVVDGQGRVVATRQDIQAGQSVFLRYGLMSNGSVWGHGAYLGPDYPASALHAMGVAEAQDIARRTYGRPLEALPDVHQAGVRAEVAEILKHNRYTASDDTLRLSPGETLVWRTGPETWRGYFVDPSRNGGLRPELITDPQELRTLSAFFNWAAWASVANRPGKAWSYTNNFPYDPLVGNRAVPGALLWSALSFICLLGGIGGALFVLGRFDASLGWISHPARHVQNRLIPGQATPAQRALTKFFVVVALLFLLQTLLGGAVAHYRAEPGDFYGLPLEKIFPSNLMRSWHLQTAIFWVATALVAAGLFLATCVTRNEPKRLVVWINVLFVAFGAVIAGSLLGIWAGLWQWMGANWFWFGNQGWEFMELGRFWQILLVAGLTVWFAILWFLCRPERLITPALRPIVSMFLLGALAIPVFYVPALMIGETMHFTIVDTWRFWIIHLWVEAYFEFFATATVALSFYMMGIAERNVALRVIYFDAILIFIGGVVGTGHHWYYNGQSQFNMAASALASALEVVPLTMLTAEAWDFVRVTRKEQGADAVPHTWVFWFLMAVGFWNFLGAGVFGFLINTPIVAYYEVGTMLTPNHGHAAMMGVFGMLALAMLVLVLQQVSSPAHWKKMEPWVRCSFWGTNLGLALMMLLSLFPGGILQLLDVMQHGYWHARELNYTASPMARHIEWLRMIGDMIFIVCGAIPIAVVALRTWGHVVATRTGNS